MTEFRRLAVLRPTVNVDTLKDGRGGILTWVPPDEIVEFSPVDTKAGAVPDISREIATLP
jgi:hypothetical protein